MIYFCGRFPQLPICWWPIPQHVVYTELGLASQYLSTTLTTPPNRRPDAQSFLASASPLMVMTIADPRFPFSFCPLKRFSFMSHRGRAFHCMLIEDLTSRLSSSILSLPRYLLSGISYTFSCCQYSNISTPTTAWSMVLAARISMLENQGITDPAFAFLVRSADTALDGEYLTWQNRVSKPSPAFCSTLFSASIKFASDIWCPDVFWEKRILLPKCSSFTAEFVAYGEFGFRFFYFTLV